MVLNSPGMEAVEEKMGPYSGTNQNNEGVCQGGWVTRQIERGCRAARKAPSPPPLSGFWLDWI